MKYSILTHLLLFGCDCSFILFFFCQANKDSGLQKKIVLSCQGLGTSTGSGLRTISTNKLVACWEQVPEQDGANHMNKN